MKHVDRMTEQSRLGRMSERLQAGGVMESIDAQLNMGKVVDTAMCKKAMRRMCKELQTLLGQCMSLEQIAESVALSLTAEKRMNLDLRVENKTLKEQNAELEKANRNLKISIDNQIRHGRLS